MLLLPLPARPDTLATFGDRLHEHEVRERWLGRLSGRHFTARVTLQVRRGTRSEERRLEVFRDEPSPGRERLMARFESPTDMRGLALLYLEQPDRTSDYFLYQPSSRRVRRIPERLAKQDVYGVDLEYLGFGLALVEASEAIHADWKTLEGRPAVRLEERALAANSRFDRRVVWLDPTTWISLRTEHRHGGKTRLVARTEEIVSIQGIPTPKRVVFQRPLDDEVVTMTVDDVDYEKPIPAAFFSTLELLKTH